MDIAGLILGSYLEEKVSLNWLMFSYFELGEKFKCIEHIGKVQIFFLKSSPSQKALGWVIKKKKMSSFKNNENIHKKECGSYYVVSANKASSVTL